MRIEQLRHPHGVGGQHDDRLLGPCRSTLRARIDGAVMRLPGTGDGVARLVLVSMVKVDMRRLLAVQRRHHASPRRVTPGRNVRNLHPRLMSSIWASALRTMPA